MTYRPVFDEKLEYTLGRNYPTIVRDELFSMICNDKCSRKDIEYYLSRYKIWTMAHVNNTEKPFSFPPMFFESTLCNYLQENWENLEKWERDFIIDQFGYGDADIPTIAKRMHNFNLGKRASIKDLTVGTICQLNNLYLRSVMTDGDCMDYALLDEYISKHSNEEVAFVEVMDCDDKESNIKYGLDYGFEEETSEGAIAYIGIFKTYNDSFGMSMDVDFNSEVAIIRRKYCGGMAIEGTHIDIFLGKAPRVTEYEHLWECVKERAERYLMESADPDALISLAKENNAKRIDK